MATSETPPPASTSSSSSSAAAAASTEAKAATASVPGDAQTVGWDDSLTKSTAKSSLDANDYSRFKDIGIDEPDSEEEREKERKRKAALVAPTPSACRNCGKSGARLKCSICKKACYCARSCQANDWVFHKRICKKPAPANAKKTPERPNSAPPTSNQQQAKSSPMKASSSTSTSPTKSSSSNSSKPDKEVVLNDPELKDVRGYKNGLPYFHRELTKEEHEMIGDIAPKKIEQVATTTNPTPLATTATVEHEGSAWNAAGTFEERDYSKWVEQKLKEMFKDLTYAQNTFEIVFKTMEKVEGDASICVVRGRKRFLFDYSFKLPVEVTLNGTTKYKGSFQMQEISNEEQYEISFRWEKRPQDEAELSKVQSWLSNDIRQYLVEVLQRFVKEFQSQ